MSRTAGGYDLFLVACSTILRDLRSGGLTSHVNRNLTSLRDAGRLADGGSDRGIALIGLRPLTAILSLHKEGDPKPSLFGMNAHVFLASLGPGPIGVELFALGDGAPEVFDKTRKPELIEVQTLSPGESIAVEAHGGALRPCRVDAPTLVLSVASEPVPGFIWEYHPENLEPKRLLFGTLAETRLQFAARALGQIGTDASIAVLESLLLHENYAIRWESLSAMMRLDERHAAKFLMRALDDAHPMIRAAAHTTLDANPRLKAAETWL